jgi:hypothetical protein
VRRMRCERGIARRRGDGRDARRTKARAIVALMVALSIPVITYRQIVELLKSHFYRLLR